MKRPEGMSYEEYRQKRKFDQKKKEVIKKGFFIEKVPPSTRRQKRQSAKNEKEMREAMVSYVDRFGQEKGMQLWMKRYLGIEMKKDEEE